MATGIDLSVIGDWWKGLRPEKFRLTFDNATADVSLKDADGIDIYASATYASGDEVYLDFAGADIDRLVLSGSGDLTDIEFLLPVEKGRKVVRKQPPAGSGNFRRPYLEGNPGYVEDNQQYPDVAIENARIKATGKTRPHMTFKQPYRYEDLQKMKYRNEAPFPHEEERLPEETPDNLISDQMLFPELDLFPEPLAIPAPPSIPELDPIPESVPQEGCGKVVEPNFRAPKSRNYEYSGRRCGRWQTATFV